MTTLYAGLVAASAGYAWVTNDRTRTRPLTSKRGTLTHRQTAMTTRLLPRVFAVLATALVSACSRNLEVNVLSQTASVNGAYTAEVREVVYGPHFGGEAPAIEVWVSHAGESECVLQRPEDGTEATSRWVVPAQLRIQVTGSQAAEHFQPASLGATIELERL